MHHFFRFPFLTSLYIKTTTCHVTSDKKALPIHPPLPYSKNPTEKLLRTQEARNGGSCHLNCDRKCNKEVTAKDILLFCGLHVSYGFKSFWVYLEHL